MTHKTEKCTIQEARKIVLLSQQISNIKKTKNSIKSTLSTIEHLGYIQIDTISVIQRAHHHTIWNRNPAYKTTEIDSLLSDKKIFEYWSHAAAYLPMKDFRFSLPNKEAISTGKQKHWYKPDKKIMRSVLDRIKSEGPLMAKDFETNGKKLQAWQAKPTKQALGNLFIQGDIMISSRKHFHKVYDLTERVLPSHVDTSLPNSNEYARFLILRYLKANGIGQISEICYLLKNIKNSVSEVIDYMIENQELIVIDVKGTNYLTTHDSLQLLETRLNKSTLKILSPFDNVLIQRKRTKALFDFDYLLECYVPAAKRKFGYFVLPILWNGRLIARMDCKADRKSKILHIHHLNLESWFNVSDRFIDALIKELQKFIEFNACIDLAFNETTPATLKVELKNRWKKFR